MGNDEIGDLKVDETIGNLGKNPKSCPECNENLQKCLIQQNYSMVICPNPKCVYPFNQKENIEGMNFVEENEVLEFAKQRLSNGK
ncbi:hypothetical protein Kpol_1051p39 [Vanderwaltozyma polyspora DSM 70294]|uniref:Uncharacterized protein n=1 Tax=Vanderwaltozyma polyspora (strain ATCC 22028 / DSM 70294 / BCRC 21397 / CBS 2163 / NBRC 10782 / NRRL Y-8283 / UCD 57-17) TaxID=436907 RepID=A7TN01_VANPO|nr:uncharacterized protein Kpol_1051p39 [Vanderwaltozyma polyspora DSM 70294]EDO16389.1 hypothetical protein Kpol_1051p39 [Vanderwaltozyma polyspora DSM 70294]